MTEEGRVFAEPFSGFLFCNCGFLFGWRVGVGSLQMNGRVEKSLRAS